MLDIVTAQYSGTSGAPGESWACDRQSCSMLGHLLLAELALDPHFPQIVPRRSSSCLETG